MSVYGIFILVIGCWLIVVYCILDIKVEEILLCFFLGFNMVMIFFFIGCVSKCGLFLGFVM